MSEPKSRSQTAASRANQVSEHLSSSLNEKNSDSQDQKRGAATEKTSTRRRRKVKKEDDDLPADYSDILGHLTKLRTLANIPDLSRRGYVRPKQDGKLWVRERINLLFDKDSFQEIGEATGHVT
ncbi:hypothetical protein CBER1_10896 [Cercospora berteroae]|uniref:Uncharacterized protein n=1 Tax=Cercospora berteroae TaxID=357750 RepID=A0A2S6BYW3_9PEZI|nr:hypothetical protein CBER1_10896 [Cercospora berteroae]